VIVVVVETQRLLMPLLGLTGEHLIVQLLVPWSDVCGMAANWMPYAVMLHHHLPGRLLRRGDGASVCVPALGICRKLSGHSWPTRQATPVSGS
jgi:hypothetical protein